MLTMHPPYAETVRNLVVADILPDKLYHGHSDIGASVASSQV